MWARCVLLAMLILSCSCASAGAQEVVLIKDGQARAALFVPKRLLDDTGAEPPPVWRTLKPDALQRRLRESVKDFAAILERIAGAKLDIVAGPPGPGEKRLPILVGELAVQRFGKPQKSYPYGQGFRIVVSEQGIGLAGESDLATSYALYTVLDHLGCRWYMPSPMGEVLPQTRTVALKKQDVSSGPYTIFRGLWYCDNDFARRNRLGGMELQAGHALEFTVPKELRKTHPEIRAIIGGKPDPHRVKWTHPLVAKALANAILMELKKDPTIPSFSLSPDDGISWDESDDTKYDVGDFDPAAGLVSKTDRLMVLANRVAKEIAPRHPHVLLGILAYADYTRPPVREQVHPNVIPEIAPITFSRAHPMSDDGEPNNKALRYLIEGWGKKARMVSYYFYAYNLAEPAAPNPHITKWSLDLPIIYKNNCKFWQPETTTNFETMLPAQYLGLRLAWDPDQQSGPILDEMYKLFYGSAGPAMARYWGYIDAVWVNTPEYSGCGFGHLRRFTPERIKEARQLMDQALAAAKTPAEKFRVQMADDSLKQFELFLKLRCDLADGRFAALDTEAKSYIDRLLPLCDKYEKQFAFGRMGWTGKDSLYGRYFADFYKFTYDDAARLARNFTILTQPPLRHWRYQVDRERKGEAAGWAAAGFADGAWKNTDVAVETWSSIGLHNYMGSLWYRTTVKVPAVPASKKVYLWIGATDGQVKVFVNGKHVPHVDPKGKPADFFTGYCRPASFDITAAVQPGRDNHIALFCTRDFLNELGTGGLLAPVVIYRDRD
jgi:hypothetical protein